MLAVDATSAAAATQSARTIVWQNPNVEAHTEKR